MYVTHRPMWYDYVQIMIWLCQKAKIRGPNTKPCQKPYKFDLEVWCQIRLWIMNVRCTLCQYGMQMYKKPEVAGRTWSHVKKKSNTFNLEVKDKIINVRDTLFHGDGSMYQMCYAKVDGKKATGRTRNCIDRWTDISTDRQPGRVIPI